MASVGSTITGPGWSWGDLTLAYESMDLRTEPDLTITIYTAEPGSPAEDGLRLLASWAASQDSGNTAGRLSTP